MNDIFILRRPLVFPVVQINSIERICCVDIITYPSGKLVDYSANFEQKKILMGFFLLTWFNFNARMDKVIKYAIKCELKLLILSQTSTAVPLKFGNRYVISCHILLGMLLFIHAEIKVPC